MAADGKLMFETGIDNSGFTNDVSNLQTTANVAMGNIAANMVSQMSSAAAQIPQQIITVGSGFEASMSQVAATMGITSAAAEFRTLSDAAKEMGETTKFSASQAGEALNYLALAGYDANKAVAALPTVLNVAAAGGMELAAASDMVTDAMSALGLETSQMADFSDKLAVTAQKSNTSVSQLGEEILTVGGTAKMLSGGVTEMNTALGILADNGIKGSEGGTALRNVILSLSAPTDTAAAALDSLGVTAFDASGAMRPLQDTFADLNTALSTLSDQERTAVLNEIFNKVDLKSVNALLGTSSERFDELSGYISDCAGAAAQMAQTMDDNLKGDLTIMQSALEGLGIAVYEKFQVPFRDAVQEVTSSVGDLSESISDSSIVVPTFYVKSRNVDGNFASWVCADRMSKTDVLVEFSDGDFTDEKISAGTVLARAVSAAGFSGYRFTSSSAAGFIGIVGNIKRESAEGKTARDIINSFATAFCSYVIEGNGGEMVFVPFGSYYQAAGTSEIKHAPLKYRGKKQYSKLIMYSGDKTFTAGSGEAENTLMISTEFASAELCAAVFEEIQDFEYRGWTCENGLVREYIYPGAIWFGGDNPMLCTNVTMYPSAAGIFFSASANAVPETDYAYRSQVQRQLDLKLELDKRNGNSAYTKNGINVFQNLNNGGSDVRKKATVVTAFKSEV